MGTSTTHRLRACLVKRLCAARLLHGVLAVYRSNWHGTSVGQEAGQRKGVKVCT